MTICDVCKKQIADPLPGAFTTNYGVSSDNKKACYSCCADADRAQMQTTGKIVLYLSKNKDDKWVVSNWPGSLVYRAAVSETKTPYAIAKVRRDVWFKGPQGDHWYGTQQGNFSQLCFVKRLKHKQDWIDHIK